MIPHAGENAKIELRVPRVGGGDPDEVLYLGDNWACSPRRRG